MPTFTLLTTLHHYQPRLKHILPQEQPLIGLLPNKIHADIHLLINDTFGTSHFVLCREVVLFKRWFST